MKVRTNLTPNELELAGIGLQELAKSQRSHKVVPVENDAEAEILRRADAAFDQMLESLQSEIARILLE